MLYYENIDISEGIDPTNRNSSKECTQQTFVGLQDVFNASSA